MIYKTTSEWALTITRPGPTRKIWPVKRGHASEMMGLEREIYIWLYCQTSQALVSSSQTP